MQHSHNRHTLALSGVLAIPQSAASPSGLKHVPELLSRVHAFSELLHKPLSHF